jgi:hypothetical protein
MARGLDIAKASAESVARYPRRRRKGRGGNLSRSDVGSDRGGWRGSAPKALQRQFAAYVEQTPVKSKSFGYQVPAAMKRRER